MPLLLWLTLTFVTVATVVKLLRRSDLIASRDQAAREGSLNRRKSRDFGVNLRFYPCILSASLLHPLFVWSHLAN